MAIKKITYASIIAAIYIAATFLLTSISYGPFQCRISEALTVLPVLTPVAIPGLFVGCFIANLIAGNIIDIIFGSLTTLVAAILTYKTRKNIWVAMIFPVILNAIVVGGYLGYGTKSIWFVMLSVGVGQIVACYVIGIPLYMILKKTNLFNKDGLKWKNT